MQESSTQIQKIERERKRPVREQYCASGSALIEKGRSTGNLRSEMAIRCATHQIEHQKMEVLNLPHALMAVPN